MVESRSQIPKEALGMDLPVGHTHSHHYARTDAPPQCHRPARRKVRSQNTVGSASERGRAQMPIVPQLRAVKRDPEEIPVSEGSAVSSASPRSGRMRAHPYHPRGGAIGGSFFKIVPSSACNRATRGQESTLCDTKADTRSDSCISASACKGYTSAGAIWGRKEGDQLGWF